MKTTTGRRLTDEQLRTAKLVLVDPLTVEGLSNDSPDKDFPPVVLGEYHLPSDKPQLRCSYCRQRAPHRKGFLVEFAPGSIHLVGSVCGPTQLDLQFGHARQSHADLVRRQGYLRRVDLICASAAHWTDSCDGILFSTKLAEIEAKSAELKKTAGDAFARLRATFFAGRQLSEEVDVRDFEAERRRDELSSNDDRGGPIFRKESISIGQLRGTGLLQGDALRAAIHTFKRNIQNLRSIALRNTDNITTKNLVKELLRVENDHVRANEAIRALNDCHRFFDVDHLELLARWSVGSSSDRLANNRGKLTISGRDGRAYEIEPLEGARFDALPELYDR